MKDTSFHATLSTARGLNASFGTGGTNDYEVLKHKPSINNVVLSGNKTSEDLGIDTSKPEAMSNAEILEIFMR